ncbi:MAG TPA: TrkA family potassium uptake protein [Streptosporangiaceae bacterium]|nr:TrkA family potassium uptake protein [Streptosporangiaceae bacterium]
MPSQSGDDPTELEDHVILCGANALASRMAEELTARYGLAVAAIVPSAADQHAARMTAMPGVRVLERAELDADAFLAANLAAARGLAILNQDDLGNLHAALRAQELSPELRLVIAIFNTGLGERIRSFFTDCAVLSEAQMAAPSLVAAALGEPAPSHVEMASRTMYVARREDVGADQVICGLAASSDADAPNLLPPADPVDRLVLAVADGTPRDPLSRQRRRRLLAPLRAGRRFFSTTMGLVFAALTAILGIGFALLTFVVHHSVLTALYLTMLDAAGAAFTGSGVKPAEEVAQFVLTFDGLAFLPLVTAAIVSARLPASTVAGLPPLGGHVIVAGLGTVGARVIEQLHDLGIDVVGVDKSAEAAGIPVAKRLGIRVVIGETQREETLQAAGIGNSQALVSVTDSDVANLETALNARALAAEPRIVVRLYDDDLAARVQRTIGNTVSRSTSYLAAPAFAAAVLDHQVLRTIAVGRHVLLMAEVAADNGSALAGQVVAEVHQPGLLRVIALRRAAAAGGGDASVDWSPPPSYVIQPGDGIVVLATRAGLSGLLRRYASPAPAAAPPGTSGK